MIQGAYTKPWDVTLPLILRPDTELLEYICNENNKYFDILPRRPTRIRRAGLSPLRLKTRLRSSTSRGASHAYCDRLRDRPGDRDG